MKQNFSRLTKQIFIVMMVFLVFPGYSFGANDYPYPNSICDSGDPWDFAYRNCTSYVAWRMNRDAGTPNPPYSFYNYMEADNCTISPSRWTHASHWADHARELGYEVNDIPMPGAIAQWSGGEHGHVAYVESVNEDGTVNISEYNVIRCEYGERFNKRAENYIHINTVPLQITTVSSPESGRVRITGGTGAFGSSKGSVSVGAKFAQKQMSAAFDPQVISWTDTQIELNLFVSGFSIAEFGWPVEISIQKSNGSAAGTLYYPFKDVRDYDWYAQYVTALWKEGVVKGEKDGTTGNFLPGEDVTRAEFIKMAVLASGTDGCSTALPYNDIDANHWAYQYVQTAYCENWLENKAELNPNEPVNRAEAAKILVSALGKADQAYTGSPIYKDVSSSSEWYYNDVNICTMAGIFQGYTPGKTCDGSDAVNPEDRYFCPSKDLNRGEAAKIIYKTFLGDLPNVLFGVAYEQFAPDRTIEPPSLTLQGNSLIRDDEELTISALGMSCATCDSDYEWAADTGELQVQGQTKALWIPPQVSSDSNFTISVSFSDGEGHTETEFHEVTVTSAKIPCISVSGRITDSSGKAVEGVQMGGLPALIWTNGNGEYSQCVGEGWDGTVTPFKAGHTFTPSSKTFSNVMENQTLNFTSESKSFTIKGQVTYNNAGLEGVVIKGLPGDPVSDSNGIYMVQVPFHWAGTGTAQKNGYSFSPSPRIYEEVRMGLFEEDYTAVKQGYRVSGQVIFNGSGLEGVVLNGLPGGVVTDSGGSYSANVEHGWSGTVSPYKQGFEIDEKIYTGVSYDTLNEDYTAVKSAETAKVRIVTNSQELRSSCSLAREGDIVLVKPGIYESVNIDIDSNTSLISEGGPGQTFLKLSSDIEFGNSASNVTIDGFTIEYPGLNNSYETMMRIAGDSNIQIRNCKIILPVSGRGIQIESSDNILIEGCIIDNQNNNRDSGILLRAGASGQISNITIRNNQFISNYKGISGNGDYTDVLIENNIFKENEMGIYDISDVNSLKVSNNIFEKNNIGADLDYGIPRSIEFINNTFVGNSKGVDTNASAIFYNNIFQNNSPGINGGGKATITIHHQMDWNSSSFSGFATYNRDENTIWEKDPQFVSFSSGDYHLRSYSPAKGVGVGGTDLGAYGGAKGNAWKTPLTLPRNIPQMTDIEIRGADQINRGQTVQLYAKALFDGYEGDINHVGTWSSSNTQVLASQGKGGFLAADSGMSFASVSYSGMQQQYAVTVLDSDLTVSLADNTDPVPAGNEFQYIVTYQNKGYGEAENVRISLTYDPNVIFISADPESDTGTINSWTLGNLSGSQGGSIAVTVRTDESLPEGTQLVSNVSIASAYDEPVQIAQQTTVSGYSALQLSVKGSPDTVRPGDSLDYTVSYENTGTGTAYNVRIAEIYDPKTTYVSASPAPTGGNSNWLIDVLPPGAKGGIQVSVRVSDDTGTETSLKNEVIISADDVAPSRFSVLTSLDKVAVLKGDLDNSGDITAQDAKDAFNLSLKTSWTAEELAVADIDGDGDITAQDAKSIFELSLAN